MACSPSELPAQPPTSSTNQSAFSTWCLSPLDDSQLQFPGSSASAWKGCIKWITLAIPTCHHTRKNPLYVLYQRNCASDMFRLQMVAFADRELGCRGLVRELKFFSVRNQKAYTTTAVPGCGLILFRFSSSVFNLSNKSKARGWG